MKRMEKGIGKNEKIPKSALIIYALFFTYALSTGLLGTFMSTLLAQFDVSVADGGTFTFVQYLGSTIATLFSGWLLCRYRKWNLVIAAGAVLALSDLIVRGVFSFPMFLAVLFLLGISGKLVDVSGNALVAQVFSARKGLYMNLLHATFGTGNFLGPIFAGWVLTAGIGWQTSFVATGILAAAIVVLTAGLKHSGSLPETAPDQAEKLQIGKLLSERRVRMLMLSLFFYCGHQIGISSWIPLFMEREFGVSAGTAGIGVSVFWLGLIAGRLACSWLTGFVDVKKLLAGGLIIATAGFAAGILIHSPAAVITGCAIAGLFAGAAIPLCLILTYDSYALLQGTASMLMFVSISAGQLLYPWLMGIAAEHAGLMASMMIDIFCMAGAAVTAMLV